MTSFPWSLLEPGVHEIFEEFANLTGHRSVLDLLLLWSVHEYITHIKPRQYYRFLSGVVGHRHAFRDIDNVFSVKGLNLASPWKIFGGGGGW